MDNRRRILFIIIAVFVVASIGVIIFSAVWKATHNASLELLYAPSSATATINGRVVKAGNTVVTPGSYTLVVKKEGFETSTQTIDVKSGQQSSASVCLIANSPSTEAWYVDHEDDGILCDQAAAKGVHEAANYVEDHFPISKELPVTGFDYKIDYGESPTRGSKEFAVLITYYDADGKQNALNAIKFLGYDPSTFEIIYTDKSK